MGASESCCEFEWGGIDGGERRDEEDAEGSDEEISDDEVSEDLEDVSDDACPKKKVSIFAYIILNQRLI